ncbi:4597_t:CDS:2 [Entrophospora sp. SA101]|nr:4597_t:CDS:2 [Entrophospora sp. SA101]
MKSSVEVTDFWENNIVSQCRREIWSLESVDEDGQTSLRMSGYKHKAHLLIAEFKPPRNKDQKLWNDLVKLGNEMKDAIDKAIDDSVDGNVLNVTFFLWI